MSLAPQQEPVNQLAIRIRSQRRNLGLTQAELAKRSSVSRQFVIELEQGHPRAELQKVLSVLSTLKLSPIAGPNNTPSTAPGGSTSSARTSMTITATPTLAETIHPESHDWKKAAAFADAALALAGHRITDPVLRELANKAARAEITDEMAIAKARRHIQEK